jgi:hypothetical protein
LPPPVPALVFSTELQPSAAIAIRTSLPAPDDSKRRMFPAVPTTGQLSLIFGRERR